MGGIAIGIGGYFQPHALGEGYDVIEGLLHGDFPPTAVISLLVLKLLIWAILFPRRRQPAHVTAG